MRDNIPGFISIVQLSKSNDFLLAWIPEAAVEGTPDYESYVLVELGPADASTTLVTAPPAHSEHAWSIPIRSLYSLQVQPPTLSSWYGSITFSVYAGESLPALWFHDEESPSSLLDRDRRVIALGALGAQQRAANLPQPSISSSARSPTTVGRGESIPPSWGGEALLTQLKLYAHVIRSQLEPTLYLVNPSRSDIEAHSTALFDDEAVPDEALQGLRLVNGSNGDRTGVNRAQKEARRQSILHQSLDAQRGGTHGDQDYPDEVGEPAMDNFTFNVLTSFSKLTRGCVHEHVAISGDN